MSSNQVHRCPATRCTDVLQMYLATRIKERNNSQSAIHEHSPSSQNCKLNFSHNCFDVIDSGKINFETTGKEALYVKLKKPMLNKQLFLHGSSFALNLF